MGHDTFEVRYPAQEAGAGDPVAYNSNCPTYASFAHLTRERAESRLGST